MRHRWIGLAVVVIALVGVAGCFGGDDETLTPTPTTVASVTATVAATGTVTPTPTGTATEAPSMGTALGRQTGGGSCDALFPSGLEVGQAAEDVFVCIDGPAPGASIGTSVTVSGYQAGAFEQNVVVEVRDASGAALARQATTANAPDIGLVVGAWTVDLDVSGGVAASIAAFAESARDGSIDFGGEIEVAP